MKNFLSLLFVAFLLWSCSSDDGNPNSTLSVSVTVDLITPHSATLHWTVQGNTSPVTYEIVLNGEEIIDGFDGNQYTLEGLNDQTPFSGKVFAKEQSGNQTFGSFSFTTNVDTALDGGYLIETQEQVDNFYYTSITGYLTICGPDVVDISGLSSIQKVGNLRICNTSLNSLDGLDNLEQLTSEEKRVYIINNPLLEDVSALSHVSSSIRRLEVLDNESLTSSVGLGMNETSYSIRMENSAFTDLSTFTNLRSIQDIYISNMPNLTSISGLTGLETVFDEFIIKDCESLQTLGEMPNLTSIYTRLHLENLPSLTSIDGISSIQNSNNLNLTDLESLESIAALSNVDFPKQIIIRNLNSLSSLEGLTAVTSPDYLALDGLNSLNSLAGLNNINYVYSSILLRNIPNLQSLNGLENLTDVAHWEIDWEAASFLSLENLPSLTSVTGVPNLSFLGGIRIQNCPSLTSLDGLDTATESNTVSCIITDNPNLVDFCGLQPLASQNAHDDPNWGFYAIENNGYNPTWSQIASSTECSL